MSESASTNSCESVIHKHKLVAVQMETENTRIHHETSLYWNELFAPLSWIAYWLEACCAPFNKKGKNLGSILSATVVGHYTCLVCNWRFYCLDCKVFVWGFCGAHIFRQSLKARVQNGLTSSRCASGKVRYVPFCDIVILQAHNKNLFFLPNITIRLPTCSSVEKSRDRNPSEYN